MNNHGFYYPLSWDEFISDLKDPPSLLNTCQKGKYDRVTERTFFDGDEHTLFLKEWWYPVIGFAFFYLFATYILAPALLPDHKIKPKWLLILWNLMLGGFSGAGVYYVGWELFFSPESGLLTVGFHEGFCDDSERYGNGMVGYFVYLFVTSKIIELGDTVWLVLGKRKIIPLHTWHHFSVTIWSWHSYIVNTSLGLTFAFMNYFVHSVMYNYYAMTQISDWTKSLVKPLAIFVTRFQIVQMFFGLVANFTAGYYVVFTDRSCCLNPTNNVLGTICYVTYLFLFMKLYLNRYNKKGNKEKAKRN